MNMVARNYKRNRMAFHVVNKSLVFYVLDSSSTHFNGINYVSLYCCSANQPPNLTVLSSSSATTTPTPTARQPKSATSHNQALYAVGAGPSSAAGSGSGSLSGGSENSDLMIRLRESIKQKEEFLKSPVPASMSSASSINGNQAQSSSPAQQQHLQQHQQHFFPSQ